MAKARRLIGTVAIAAMLVGAAAPAAARPWGYYPHRHWHRGGGDGLGNFLLGAIVAGGVIAAVSSANRNKVAGQAERGYDDVPPPGGPYADDGRGDAPRTEEDVAVDACADAAGAQAATRYDRDARVDDITYSGRDGQGWRVEGNVGTGYKGQIRHHFVCGVRSARVNFIQFVDQSTER
ncbi:hypothetical protein [Flavisphingomonas formosensis]|uniref:hypothetical protein n=1 Tax=Flavisphingomonas formosensis TaxID=861534 RepID=UPI0012F8F753|nr:hypothetical protein [Sphingomonas formosensis]